MPKFVVLHTIIDGKTKITPAPRGKRPVTHEFTDAAQIKSLKAAGSIRELADDEADHVGIASVSEVQPSKSVDSLTTEDGQSLGDAADDDDASQDAKTEKPKAPAAAKPAAAKPASKDKDDEL